MAPENFVHLHNHSDYSLLDGAMKTRTMARRAAEYGMPALALTDHGNLFGAVEFYRACKAESVKPILGMEAYITRDRHDRDSEHAKRNHHIVLLATDARGWRNLIRLSTAGYLEGFYYKPRIDRDLLAAHSEGLVGLSACMSGEPNRMLIHDDLEGAIRAAGSYAEIFGRDRYFLEIQNHGLAPEDRIRELMPRVARAVGVGIVATNDCHFLEQSHHQAHDILLAIQTNRQYDDPGRWRSQTDQVFFKSPAQMRDLFQDWPEALENTLRIADMVDFDLELGKLLLPEFPLPPGFASADDYVAHLAEEGLGRRYREVTAELRERLAYELSIIRRMRYAGYFLIVWDFIDAARRMGIPVGPGRGSAAGSLVCYAMGITNIDPISNSLIFERFLNPGRISMPDIDIDFCMEKRGRIIQYVAEKYGKDNVSQIITFGTMAARAVLKDVARVLGFSFQDADRISKLVPEEIGMTLEKALAEAPGLAAVRRESPRHDMLIKNALILEGLCRNPGIHAAGILITPTPLVNHAPLYKSAKDEITVQFDMRMAEQLGLLKMDFLGLRTLTVIDKALRLIEGTKGIALTADEIPLDDPETFALLQRGRTVGVFQLESSGMQELVRKMKPTCFEDITAVNALFRPGPIGAGMHEVYVDCKHGRKRVTYKHPLLEPILTETYGVILYQEQVMQIARDLGGFSMGKADTLRKAMGKKKRDMMEKLKVEFVEGAAARGIRTRLAQEIYDEMAFFAEYGFNKSHSASYAVISLQTAWLKAHHPAEFMAATMTTEMRRADRVTELIDEVKALGLAIAPPDINVPDPEFGVRDGDTIVFGMGAVKGVGVKAIEEIREVRERLGRDFRDLFDLCESLDLQRVNRKVLEGLIHAGALDALPGHRRQLIENLDRAIAHGQKSARDRLRGQDSLFGGETVACVAPVLAECEPYDPLELLSLERRAVGFFLSGHPFHEYREFMAALPVTSVADAGRLGENAAVDLAGVVTSFTHARDKRKRVYARAHFEDRTGLVELTAFADLYEQKGALVRGDSILIVRGHIRVRGDGTREVWADEIHTVEEALRHWTRGILLRLDLSGEAGGTVRSLEEFCARHAWSEPDPDTDPGPDGSPVPLLVEIERDGQRWILRSQARKLLLSLETLRGLRALPGSRGFDLRCALPPAAAGGRARLAGGGGRY